MGYVLFVLLLLIGIYLFRHAVDRASARGIVRLVLLLLAVFTIVGMLAVRSNHP